MLLLHSPQYSGQNDHCGQKTRADADKQPDDGEVVGGEAGPAEPDAEVFEDTEPLEPDAEVTF